MGRRAGRRKLTRREKIATGKRKKNMPYKKALKKILGDGTPAICKDPAFNSELTSDGKPAVLGISVADGVQTAEKIG